MANKQKTTTAGAKPADAKPAAKPATRTGVGIKELAADLGGRDPKAVRSAIRRLKGGAQVGQGARYEWDSRNAPEYRELLAALSAKPAKAEKPANEEAAA